MYSTVDFKKGLKIEIDGTPYVIVDFLHEKRVKGGAFVRTKLKSLLSGRVLDQTFRSGEKVKRPDLMEREMQFLYREGDDFHMMDNEDYEQLVITTEQMGDAILFLTENLNVKVLFFNQQPVGVELPTFVENTSGTVSGSITRGATGKIDRAYNSYTSGEGDWGDPADGHLDFGTSSFTLSAWLNIDASVGAGAWPQVIWKGNASWGTGYALEYDDDYNNFYFVN